jgi:4-amino-4-deoxy-L-arabinose transferase-like glycosyltransferase
MGLIVGLGLTAYGVFVVVLGCIVAAALLALWRVPANRRQIAINLIVLLALSALPTSLWYLIDRAMTGEFFSAEINEQAFVWMLRLWGAGADALAAEWFRKLGWMLRYAAPQATALIALVMFLIWVSGGRWDLGRGAAECDCSHRGRRPRERGTSGLLYLRRLGVRARCLSDNPAADRGGRHIFASARAIA